MKFEIGTIKHIETSTAPQIEVVVNFTDEAKFCPRSGNVRVYLESKDKDYTISEVKTEAVKAAKEFLGELVRS